MKEVGDEEPVVNPTDDVHTKNVSYLAALQHLGITQKNTEKYI